MSLLNSILILSFDLIERVPWPWVTTATITPPSLKILAQRNASFFIWTVVPYPGIVKNIKGYTIYLKFMNKKHLYFSFGNSELVFFCRWYVNKEGWEPLYYNIIIQKSVFRGKLCAHSTIFVKIQFFLKRL